jgi:hypothetical protein
MNSSRSADVFFFLLRGAVFAVGAVDTKGATAFVGVEYSRCADDTDAAAAADDDADNDVGDNDVAAGDGAAANIGDGSDNGSGSGSGCGRDCD